MIDKGKVTLPLCLVKTINTGRLIQKDAEMNRYNFCDDYFVEAGNQNFIDKARSAAKVVSRSGFKQALDKERHIDSKANPSDFHYFKPIDEKIYDTLQGGLNGNMGMDDNDPKKFVKRTYDTKISNVRVFLKKLFTKKSTNESEEFIFELFFKSDADKQKDVQNKAEQKYKDMQAKADVYGNKANASKAVVDKEGGKVSSVKVYVLMPKGKLYLLTMVDKEGNDSYYVAANTDAMKTIKKIVKRDLASVVESGGSFGKEFGGKGKSVQETTSAVVDPKKLTNDSYIAKIIGLGSDWNKYYVDVVDTRYGAGKQLGTKGTGYIYIFKSAPQGGVVIADNSEWYKQIVVKGDIKAYQLNANGTILIKKDKFRPDTAAGGASQPQVKKTSTRKPTTRKQKPPANTANDTLTADELKSAPMFITKTDDGKSWLFVKPSAIQNKAVKKGLTSIPGVQTISVKKLNVQRVAIPLSKTTDIVSIIKGMPEDTRLPEMAKTGSVFKTKEIVDVFDSLVVDEYTAKEGIFNEKDVIAIVPKSDIENESFSAFKERMLSE